MPEPTEPAPPRAVRGQLDEIDARAAAAAPGPWERHHVYVYVGGPDGYGNVCAFGEPRASTTVGYTPLGYGSPDLDRQAANATFVAHAREDVPALVAEVRRLRARVAELEESLEDYRNAGRERGGWERGATA